MNRKSRLTRTFSLVLLAVPLLLLLDAEPGWAADHFVRAGATGNGSGSDWTNACTDFAGSCAVSSLVRGDTYYVASGNYAARNFNRAVSGILVITIKGATIAEHGTAPGWLNSYSVCASEGGSQASFGHGLAFDTSYWVFNGVCGDKVADPTQYGFRIRQPASCNSNQAYLEVPTSSGRVVSNISIMHVAIVSCGPAFDIGQRAFVIGCGACNVSNSTWAHNYVTGAQKTWSITNLTDSFIEHNLSENSWSSSANHGEVVSVNNCHDLDFSGCSTACTQGLCSGNVTFRHNIIKNCRGTACIAGLDPGNRNSAFGWKVYGNVFVDGQPGNGIIATGTSATHFLKDWLVYNNTFIDCQAQIFIPCVSACSGSTGNVFKNNLLYISSSIINGGTIDRTHNTYWSSLGGIPVSEPNGQIVTVGACPLVNCSSGSAGNYLPSQEGGTGVGRINNGLTLPVPFNTDPKGKTRGADGSWERGAFEFQRPGPPQNLRAQ